MERAHNVTRALGIDIGSTTAKVVLTVDGSPVYEKYERHYSQVRSKTIEMVTEIRQLLEEGPFTVGISGSAGLGLAECWDLPFVQEVYATGEVVRRLEPDCSAVVELGGEDAKVIFFAGGLDERMNGSCAGGTGAFIDQMAVLLDMSVEELDAASLKAQRIYPVASRCGVFAKTDVQPLLNQGASKEDVAASIYQAVVNQTIGGLAQGRKLEGKILFLGGPLYHCAGLRLRFRETLGLTEETGKCPEYARFAVALGAAYYSADTAPMEVSDLLERLERSPEGLSSTRDRLKPLFETPEDYEAFRARHDSASVPLRDLESYSGSAWLGIDCGSTTTKLVLISREKELLYRYYSSNQGSPVTLILEQLKTLRRLCGDRVEICGCAVTGYGEELIRSAFHADAGLVETLAHFTAAKHFQKDVDFILDIGGQDIKCFRIRGGAIDSIMLNEACSSGCGSFLETFARSMDYSVEEFARLGLRGRSPVNLGSRCTVFMNSSVKQSQKEGATVEDISAGLSISVVKNAVYKVIRASSAKELGQHIVVQGGTFRNDAVLRAFEQELGAEVIRPAIAELMGAFGAALHAMRFSKSSLLRAEELESFTHTSRSAVCQGCENHCHLTVNSFSDGSRLISGNRCQKALGKGEENELPNLHRFKRQKLAALGGGEGKRGRLGIPLALGVWELAPLWDGLFRALGYEVVFSAPSTRRTYEKGQFTIPSDTACYPAKIVHGHMEELLEAGVDAVFFPCLTYNVNEKAGDNHYNCPLVAYYPEVIHGNMDSLRHARFWFPYLDIRSVRSLCSTLRRHFEDHHIAIPAGTLRRAVKAGFAAYQAHMAALRAEGERALAEARAKGQRIMILAGRPYHVDPEIGHGIDTLASSLGFAVLSEDSICHLAQPERAKVLNQWTYHARLYRAARFAAENPDVELVQLVSYGCGIDAITTDEVRQMLEESGKFYTQIKIDEITNLGAVRIRLRSLLGALEEQGR